MWGEIMMMDKAMRPASQALALRGWRLVTPAHSGVDRFVRYGVMLVAGSLLLTAASKLQVPFWPVPLTMQSLAVLLIGLVYGARLGGATVAFYLAQGAAGLPVFAAGGGIGYFFGPTGGYLLGFALAASLVGWCADKGWTKNMILTFVAAILGAAVIHIVGFAGLSNFYVASKGLLLGDALAQAFEKGLVPFLIGDVTKAAIAAVLMHLGWRSSRA